ncbi:hypothetical protein B7R21_06485 [Subtercola boreus]|uniref:Antirepressor protein ant N-terminal domain-containing protein n=1 Tax=Subtercola boreus TaxID=120213 RepID=A0A3E0VWX4_9MICO|nr:hypothetical protein B7R21_06485 [Subtercola boreus]
MVPQITQPTAEVATIPFHGSDILAVHIDGKPNVLLKPFIESLGIAYQPQHRKLMNKSWASVTTTVMQVPGDGQRREHTIVDVRTALMLLATIDESRVSEQRRPLLIAYQSEVADVIEAYFSQGGAINPNATIDQLDVLARRAQAQAGVLAALKGIVDDAYLEVQGRFVIGQALGIEPELDTATIPQDVESYLRDTGIGGVERSRVRSQFGKRLKGAYVAKHGREPLKVPRTINGVVTEVNGYTRQDLALFDQVFDAMGLVRS